MTRLYSIHVSTGRLPTSGYLVSREGGVSSRGDCAVTFGSIQEASEFIKAKGWGNSTSVPWAGGVNAHVIEEPITSIRRKASNAQAL